MIANVERDAKGPIANAILLARAKLVRAIKMAANVVLTASVLIVNVILHARAARALTMTASVELGASAMIANATPLVPAKMVRCRLQCGAICKFVNGHCVPSRR